MVLLRELVAGSTRFNDLRRGVPKMSPTLLSQRLKELERAGIVTRTRHSSDKGVFEYQMTQSGKELRAVVEAMGFWGQRWVEARLSLQNLDVSLLMWDMRRNLNPTPLPDGRTVRRARDKIALTGNKAIASKMQTWLGFSPFAVEPKLAAA